MRDLLDILTGGDARSWTSGPVAGLERVATLRPRELERGGVARCCPGAVPVRTDALDGVVVRGLHLVDDVDALFAELRRMLRPAGTLVVVVPSVSVRTRAELRWWPVRRPVRQGPWPHRSALDGAGWLLAAADFAVIADDRVPFTLPLPDADTARRAVHTLTSAGLWPPGLPADVTAGLADELARRSGPRATLPVPLRRLVARR